jgi:hypothetical protein
LEPAEEAGSPSSTSRLDLRIPRPQTREELAEALYDLLGLRIPNQAVCSGHSSPWDAFCNAFFAETPWAVWKAARGLGGKSFMLAVLAWMESVTLRASVSVLGGSGEQSARVHEYLRQFWMRPQAPYEALSGDPSSHKTRLIWGNVVEAQLASPRSVRGAHPQRLRIDEADEVDWKILEAARGQAMDKDGLASHIAYSSTHQYADGTMTRLMAEAREKGMPIFEWCWRETMAPPFGWLTERAKERYRQTVSTELWRVEVELGEPSPEGRAIVPALVEEMFSLGCAAGVRYYGEAKELREPLVIAERESYRDAEGEYFEFEPPVAGAAYATGADWGKIHETVIWTWRVDVTPMRLVAYEHMQRRPMPHMIERLMTRMRRYPGEGCHDSTGVGTYHHDSFTEPVEDYTMVGKKRNDLFSAYITAIESGECRAPRILSAYHAHKFCRNKDLYSGEQAEAHGEGKGHPPDPLVAGALGYSAGLSARNPLALTGGASAQPGTAGQAPTAQQSQQSALGQALSYLGRRS